MLGLSGRIHVRWHVALLYALRQPARLFKLQVLIFSDGQHDVHILLVPNDCRPYNC